MKQGHKEPHFNPIFNFEARPSKPEPPCKNPNLQSETQKARPHFAQKLGFPFCAVSYREVEEQRAKEDGLQQQEARRTNPLRRRKTNVNMLTNGRRTLSPFCERRVLFFLLLSALGPKPQVIAWRRQGTVLNCVEELRLPPEPYPARFASPPTPTRPIQLSAIVSGFDRAHRLFESEVCCSCERGIVGRWLSRKPSSIPLLWTKVARVRHPAASWCQSTTWE